jgi:branched-chain amino acid transport system permease protein
MSDLLAVLISGIAEGVPFFLAAAGLSLIFGVMGVLNFAQGGLFMVGAYALHTILGGAQASVPVFLLAVVGAAVFTAALGGVFERTLFVSTYRAGQHALIGILISFGLLLVLTGVVPYLWGNTGLTQPAPAAFSGRFDFLGAVISKYSVFLLACGAVIVVALYVLLRHTNFGKTIVAVATDRDIAAALGVRTWWVSLSVFAIAGGIAGLGGALIAPFGSIDATIGQSYLLAAFVAMVIGGLGSIPGTFAGAMIIGILDSVMVNYMPTLQPFSMYLAAIVVLVLRPHGLFGAVAHRAA